MAIHDGTDGNGDATAQRAAPSSYGTSNHLGIPAEAREQTVIDESLQPVFILSPVSNHSDHTSAAIPTYPSPAFANV